MLTVPTSVACARRSCGVVSYAREPGNDRNGYFDPEEEEQEQEEITPGKPLAIATGKILKLKTSKIDT